MKLSNTIQATVRQPEHIPTPKLALLHLALFYGPCCKCPSLRFPLRQIKVFTNGIYGRTRLRPCSQHVATLLINHPSVRWFQQDQTHEKKKMEKWNTLFLTPHTTTLTTTKRQLKYANHKTQLPPTTTCTTRSCSIANAWPMAKARTSLRKLNSGTAPPCQS